MRAYGDSSFLTKIISDEEGCEEAQAEYRRVGLPPLFFLALHGLEVENAILQRAFFDRRSLPARERAVIEQAQGEKYPEEYGVQVEQYLLNLARESAAKK